MPMHAKLLQPCLTLCYLRGAARLLHPWDFPGKNTGEGCLLQGISLPTQGSNQCLLHWQEDSLPPALNNFQQHLSNINIHMNQSGIFWKCRFTFHRPGVGSEISMSPSSFLQKRSLLLVWHSILVAGHYYMEEEQVVVLFWSMCSMS